MSAVRINERLTVAGQPDISDFSSLSDQGYKSIINARPDGEEPGQPGNEHEKAPPMLRVLPTVLFRSMARLLPKPIFVPFSRR